MKLYLMHDWYQPLLSLRTPFHRVQAHLVESCLYLEHEQIQRMPNLTIQILSDPQLGHLGHKPVWHYSMLLQQKSEQMCNNHAEQQENNNNKAKTKQQTQEQLSFPLSHTFLTLSNGLF